VTSAALISKVVVTTQTKSVNGALADRKVRPMARHREWLPKLLVNQNTYAGRHRVILLALRAAREKG
jgi:hypothetical protein